MGRVLTLSDVEAAIRGIVAEPEIGVIYTGKVVKTADFGAFVNFLGSKVVGRAESVIVVIKVTILVVEQNAQLALELADQAYVIETGEIVTPASNYLELRKLPFVSGVSTKSPYFISVFSPSTWV